MVGKFAYVQFEFWLWNIIICMLEAKCNIGYSHTDKMSLLQFYFIHKWLNAYQMLLLILWIHRMNKKTIRISIQFHLLISLWDCICVGFPYVLFATKHVQTLNSLMIATKIFINGLIDIHSENLFRVNSVYDFFR